jgi:hypothetical protein
MRRIPSRDIALHVGYLDLRVALISEGTSWSPDVATDMINRMQNLWDNTLRTAIEYGLVGGEDEDEYDAPPPEGELHSPVVVYVEDGNEDG